VYKIIVDPNASRELVEYIDWYNNAQPGLGTKFYKQIKLTVNRLQKNPLAFPLKYKTSHTALVRKFPFMIHYIIDKENNIVVIKAILHTSRDPDIWIRRDE
jgi:mRNA-degrading endonuclease RelE of RelBE toxin-antitoxin system